MSCRLAPSRDPIVSGTRESHILARLESFPGSQKTTTSLNLRPEWRNSESQEIASQESNIEHPVTAWISTFSFESRQALEAVSFCLVDSAMEESKLLIAPQSVEFLAMSKTKRVKRKMVVLVPSAYRLCIRSFDEEP